MDTIKLGRTGQIILIIVICLIIAIALFSNQSTKHNETEEDAFSKLRRRLKELQKEIEDEMNTLKLTQEMKGFLERKIIRYLKITVVSFFAIYLSIAAILYLNGLDIVSSVLSSAGIISLFCMAVSLLLVNRFLEANTIIKTVHNLIRRWIYKRYNFNPSVISTIKEQIRSKQNELNEIANKLEVAPGYPVVSSAIFISCSVNPHWMDHCPAEK